MTVEELIRELEGVGQPGAAVTVVGQVEAEDMDGPFHFELEPYMVRSRLNKVILEVR